MEWYWALTLALGVLLALMAVGLPVFAAFLVANVGGVLLVMGPRGFGLFSNSIYETVTSETFVTIPLFILMGEILFRSGSVEVLSNALDKLIGRMRGRLYFLVIALSTVFSALSGSAVAVAAMLGRSLLPQMTSKGYDKGLSNFTILGGASLAPIIPPSLLVIVIGSLVNNVSIAGLLIAGLIPGILMSSLIGLYVVARVRMQADLAPATEVGTQYSAKEKCLALAGTLPFGIVIFFVMGLIILGVATPSEAAASGVLGAAVTAVIYRRFSLKLIWDSLRSAVGISAMIMLIVASSKLFGQLLSFVGATAGLIDYVGGLSIDPWMMLVVLMLVPLILCMFIDQFAFLLLAIPLYEPIIRTYGFDPMWFWTLFLINLTIGSITPPFGYTLFALKGAAQDTTLNEIYRSAWPAVVIFVIGLGLLAVFPSLVTALPSLL
ncbi:TRAP transporter large permease subunit [Rhodospirillaceae bacterium KN72]|uniref:TRAP transporter large permease subunit n=1 Tax=Pacificispira spongiicola TaxID=2729598 RepID=A0A7Y0HGU3_9PROT|nr:TRAP transporter large permease subunit [Pacificispira spongiicola]NMM45292.1 TRAP transporter large permease subunit [Pacificispira spongiicola]